MVDVLYIVIRMNGVFLNMKNCYNNIWLQYLKQFNLEEDDKSILIIDKASSHFSEDFLNDIDLKNTSFHYIPGGLTRFLQP